MKRTVAPLLQRNIGRSTAGAISLLLAIFTLGIGLLGAVYFRLADLRRIDYLLGVLITEQADAVLACYERPIFKRYGILAFREDTPDRLGAIAEPGRLEGQLLLEQTAGEALAEGESLAGQIIDFMQLRFPAKALNLLSSLKGGLQQAQEQTDFIQEEKDELVTGQKQLSGQDWQTADWGPEGVAGAKDFVGHLAAESEAALAYDLDRGLIEGKLGDLDFLLQALEAADRLTHGEDKPILGDLMLHEFSLNMFESFVHRDCEPASPYSKSLRGRPLVGPTANGRADLEYLLTGSANEQTNINVAKALVYAERFLLRAGDYYMSAEKMGRARLWGTAISIALLALSAGSATVEPETIARIIWLIESATDTAKDCQDLYRGHASLLTPYTRKSKIELYYQDYLRLPLLFVKKEDLLKRIATVLEREAGGHLYTGIHIRMDWTSGGQQRLERQLRTYATYPYGQKTETEDEQLQANTEN